MQAEEKLRRLAEIVGDVAAVLRTHIANCDALVRDGRVRERNLAKLEAIEKQVVELRLEL